MASIFDFGAIVGATLVRKDVLPPNVPQFQPVDKESYVWDDYECDRCSNGIVGPRYTSVDKEAMFDLCSKCIVHAADEFPDEELEEVEIPAKLTPRPSSTVATADVLQGKITGLYFSASWSPPCRQFTPLLAKYYKTLQDQGKQFEVVFVSSDRDEESFEDYFNEMPWFAVPLAAHDNHDKLVEAYNIKTFPTLVLIDEFGNTINDKAHNRIATDPTGAAFPYFPKSLQEMLGNHFVNRDGQEFSAEHLKDKFIGLYFSASWCNPCQQFTPLLEQAYLAAREVGYAFEIILVSGDSSKKDYQEYLNKMPWPAIPFENAHIATEDLGDKFEVDGIPHLIILGPESSRPVVSKDAVAAVRSDMTAFPWPPKAVVDLSEGMRSNGFGIDKKAALVVFYETMSPEDQAKIDVGLKSLAAEFSKGVVCNGDECTYSDEPLVIFFTNKEDTDVGERLHHFVDQMIDEPHALLLDLPEQQVYVHRGGLDEATLRSLLKKYQSKLLEMSSLA
ncbi:hypothetical protein AC1031_021701 [Aphanomyces cochlioides]|nr:hypothetical protein AC1031_021701 [Aphanomyces cochlioides]